MVNIQVYEINSISAYCGSPSSAQYYNPKQTQLFDTKYPMISSRIRTAYRATYPYEYRYSAKSVFQVFPAIVNVGVQYDQTWGQNTTLGMPYRQATNTITMQQGCSAFNDCSGHGACDYCHQKCYCQDGYGGPDDILPVDWDIDYTCSKRKYS